VLAEEDPPPPHATKVPRNRLRIETRNRVVVCTMVLALIITKFIFLIISHFFRTFLFKIEGMHTTAKLTGNG
jgi:uncharacterized protein YqhQ